MIELNDEALALMKTSPEFRKHICKSSFQHFCIEYLSHKFTLDPAGFHYRISEEIVEKTGIIAILGFRGSAKTTIVEAYALWCFIYQTSPLTVVICADKDASKRFLANIKAEVEDNVKLKSDFGYATEERDKTSISDNWSQSQLVLNNASIIAKSRGDKIRGINFRNKRPTLIIGDDIENVNSTKTQENRRKTSEWFYTEVIPATAQGVLALDTKVILIGNLVHKDCLLANLNDKKLENGEIVRVIWIPLLRENGECNWKALYPTEADIERQKSKVMLAGQGMGQVIWAREYLLKTVSEEDQIIKDTDIQYYPDEWLQKQFENGGVGVDLAISLKQTADFTAMVKGVFVRNDYGERRLLILRNPVKERLSFEDTIHKAKSLKVEMPPNTVFYVEDVAYQKASIEIMSKNGINATGVKPLGDKRSRLIQVSPYIKSGMVLFPKNGAEEIINEIIGYGVEAHDDVLDAFVHLVYNMLNTDEVICV